MSWVGFREIKRKITIPMVMEHYGLLGQFKKSKKGFRGACPIHGGQPEHKNQFHFDDRKWKCFGGCGDQLEGHVIGLVAGMENVSLRDAALKLAEWFGLDTTHPSKREGREPAKSWPGVVGRKPEEIKAEYPAPAEPAQETGPKDEPENPELNFRLKTLTTDHPYLGVPQHSCNQGPSVRSSRKTVVFREAITAADTLLVANSFLSVFDHENY